MNAISVSEKVAVIGAGTMGAGIAQVAATAGHQVVLIDIVEGAATKGRDSIESGLNSLVKRGKKTSEEVEAIVARVATADSLIAASGCKLIIEAIVEDLQTKQQVLFEIESICSANTIIASNTSSISISALSAKAERPENIVGMHFFNPAAILKLVEVVSGLKTSTDIADTVYATCLAWGKKPVHAKSSPGFIVNRVARPFYSEALRSVNEQVASVATIDGVMRSCGGFKMGPLELTDLIGQDINNAVSESVYNAYYQDKRFVPSVLQAEMVAAGLLGRKSGKGFYDYSSDKPNADLEKSSPKGIPQRIRVVGQLGLLDGLLDLFENTRFDIEIITDGMPRIEFGEAIIQLSDGRTATQRAADQCTPNLVLLDYACDYQVAELLAISVALQASAKAKEHAVQFVQALGKQVCVLKDVPGMQVLRTIAMLVNEAHDAVNQGVCNAQAIDVAMQSGVAYPKGPMAWGQEIGLAYLVLVLNNIRHAYAEERYRVSPLLMAQQYA